MNRSDRISNLESDNNFNFTAKLSSDENDQILDPYENISLSCKYVNIDQATQEFKIKEGIKVISWNIRSLCKQFNDFQEFLDIFAEQNCFFDVIALTEIWDLKNIDCYQLKNYNFIAKTRKLSNGGGVGFYVHKSLKFKEVKEMCIFDEKVIESLTIELHLNKKEKILISNIYRCNTSHPTLTETEQINMFLNAFSNMQAKLSCFNHESYIVGDFNFDGCFYHICYISLSLLLESPFSFLSFISPF